ncbi:kinase-like protein [Rhizophagus irregularis]|uniref:Kinase-like protein n=1 Tax=Rhizophagus irregularis TaxID=588596 RepID=A0A2N0QSS8_9GLOM|nr:kinase-like protein [Rhizophagus irregularis]
METIEPEKIVEWIPYDNLQNIKYLTKGGFSVIYTAVWNDGRYDEWDSMKQQLTRFGKQKVILKRLESVGSADQSWFEEAKSHFAISNKSPSIVNSYGLTQDPSNGNYMLVMNIMDLNLREYLQQNYNQLTWKRKIQFAYYITYALKDIHDENAIHRDLHSGNILFSETGQRFVISDLGFCGPADKSPNSIYGNLPYIAPEVIAGKEYTFKSDIYSIAMLMWEISSGKPPFDNYEHDYYLAMNIINGIRPRIISGTPLEYKNLMKQCWDADPLKRPDIKTLKKKINEIYKKYLNMPNELEENNNLEINKTNSLKEAKETSSILFTSSKIHNFENFPVPRNATEEEQEEFHSKSYDDFYIPDSINDFAKSSSSKNNINSQKFSKMFKKLQVKNDSQEDYNNKKTMKHHSCIDDEDEVHNNPNLHSEEQNELEIPDDTNYIEFFMINI